MQRYLRKPRRWMWSAISLFLSLASFMIDNLETRLHWGPPPFWVWWSDRYAVVDALYLASILVALAALVPAVVGVVVGRPRWLGVIAIVVAMLLAFEHWSLIE